MSRQRCLQCLTGRNGSGCEAQERGKPAGKFRWPCFPRRQMALPGYKILAGPGPGHCLVCLWAPAKSFAIIQPQVCVGVCCGPGCCEPPFPTSCCPGAKKVSDAAIFASWILAHLLRRFSFPYCRVGQSIYERCFCYLIGSCSFSGVLR